MSKRGKALTEELKMLQQRKVYLTLSAGIAAYRSRDWKKLQAVGAGLQELAKGAQTLPVSECRKIVRANPSNQKGINSYCCLSPGHKGDHKDKFGKKRKQGQPYDYSKERNYRKPSNYKERDRD